MPDYCFKCNDCRVKLTMNRRMSEASEPIFCFCRKPMLRDYLAENKATHIPKMWNTITASDLLPPDVKGAGPCSKAFRDYAEKTQPCYGEPDL